MNKREKLILASDNLDEVVRFILKESGETIISFAKFSEVSKAYVYAMLSDKRRFTLDFVAKLHKLVKLNDNELDMFLDILLKSDTQIMCIGIKVDVELSNEINKQVKEIMVSKIKEGQND